MQLHNVETNLYEPIIHATNLPTDIERLKLLHNCLTSTKYYLDAFLLISIDSLFSSTFIEWAQLSYALIILSTHSLIKDPAWDLDHVRRVVDLSQVLEQVVKRLRYVVSLEGVERSGEADGFQRMARLMERMRAWFEKKRRGEDQDVSPMQCMDVAGDEVEAQCVDPLREDVVNGVETVDELFWEQIMGDWGELMNMEF
jgi:hypothetical protein